MAKLRATNGGTITLGLIHASRWKLTPMATDLNSSRSGRLFTLLGGLRLIPTFGRQHVASRPSSRPSDTYHRQYYRPSNMYSQRPFQNTRPPPYRLLPSARPRTSQVTTWLERLFPARHQPPTRPKLFTIQQSPSTTPALAPIATTLNYQPILEQQSLLTTPVHSTLTSTQEHILERMSLNSSPNRLSMFTHQQTTLQPFQETTSQLEQEPMLRLFQPTTPLPSKPITWTLDTMREQPTTPTPTRRSTTLRLLALNTMPRTLATTPKAFQSTTASSSMLLEAMSTSRTSLSIATSTRRPLLSITTPTWQQEQPRSVRSVRLTFSTLLKRFVRLALLVISVFEKPFLSLLKHPKLVGFFQLGTRVLTTK
uniref:Uncharacterized protein n=1 Tax=Daphnia magna TaxID=35525 RepID=A0A0N8E2B9_9CRUS